MRPIALWVTVVFTTHATAADPPVLTLERVDHWLIIKGDHMPGGPIRINYLEAYCRAGSTDADWVKHTVINHKNELVSMSDDKKTLKLKDTLADGVIVEHIITAKSDEVDFRLTARNPTDKRSEAHWAQPCVRLGPFTGFPREGGDLDDYLGKCFLFLDGKLERMPTKDWAKEARYTPGQVWCPKPVPRTDVNPRPLSKHVPSNGLIGCFSADGQWLLATASDRTHELFEGVYVCLHSDPLVAGLKPGETRTVRQKIYFLPNDPAKLLEASEDLGMGMVGIDISTLQESELMQTRGW